MMAFEEDNGGTFSVFFFFPEGDLFHKGSISDSGLRLDYFLSSVLNSPQEVRYAPAGRDGHGEM